MKVKVIRSMAGNITVRRGEIIDLPTKTAKAWIEANMAEPIKKNIESAAVSAPENAVMNQPKPKHLGGYRARGG